MDMLMDIMKCTAADTVAPVTVKERRKRAPTPDKPAPSLAATLFEARHYLGDYVDTAEFKLQELVRTTMATYPREKCEPRNGHAELAVIRALIGVYSIRANLHYDFTKVVGLALDSVGLLLMTKPAINVMHVVRKLLRQFNRPERNLPWHILPVPVDVLPLLCMVADEVRFRFELVDGGTAIGAVMQDGRDLRGAAYEALPQLAAAGLKPSPLPPYIPVVRTKTLINESVGVDRAVVFLLRLDAPVFTLMPTGRFRHNYCEERAEFGAFVAMDVLDDIRAVQDPSTVTLGRFVRAWNKAFPGAEISVPEYIIFAVRLRGLAV